MAWSHQFLKELCDRQKLNNSFTTCRHLVLPGKASFTGRKFSLFDHPHNETEIWNNPNLYNNLYLFARFIFILYCDPYVKISYPTFNTNIEFSKFICYGFKTFHCLMIPKNVNFEFSFPFSLEHNCGTFLSKIKRERGKIFIQRLQSLTYTYNIKYGKGDNCTTN